MRLPPKPKKVDPAAKRIAELEKLLAKPAYAEIPIEIVPHARAVPVGVIVHATMEWLLDEGSLERIFKENAPDQYTRDLTISSLVGLMIQVSVGNRPSVYAAFKADRNSGDPSIPTSHQALYTKLGRLQPKVAEGLVRYSAQRCGELMAFLPPPRDPVLHGYRTRVLDGNVLTGTHHRLKPLRRWLNACLPGKSLVVYEPDIGLATDLILGEDAYVQERALLIDLLPRVEANDLWIADRNFCTTRFAFGVVERGGFVLVRQHKKNLPCVATGKLRKAGETKTGTVHEQPVVVTDPKANVTLKLRRVEIRLFDKTRDGERTIGLLTNLPDTVAATVIANIYLERWTIERHFQFLTQSLHCEVPGLGRPRAALFAFAMALVAGNALAVVRATLRAAHGKELEGEVSGYYLADEASADYRTLMKYLPPRKWAAWQKLSAADMAKLLTTIAGNVRIHGLLRSKRGPKKPPAEKPVYDKKHKHYSTKRLLEGAKDTC